MRMRWPWFVWLPLFLMFILLIWYLSTSSVLTEVLAPAIGTGVGKTLLGQIIIGVVLFFIFIGCIFLFYLFPFKIQVGVIWAGLLILFLAFFYSFDLSFSFILSRLKHLLLQGAFTTVYISLISILLASIIALVAALARLSNSATAYGISTFYTSFFRGTPLLLQVFLIYSGLPQLGIIMDAIPAGITALSLCYGAYMAEIFRAGIQGVSSGQREAAQALGLKKSLIMRKIILPQAMRLIVPPTGNQFIAMLKDSSLVSVMGVWELMFLARRYGGAEFKIIEMLITAAIIYWILSIIFELIQARLEQYYGKGFGYNN